MKRKMKRREIRARLIAADKYQAQYFGYNPLGVLAYIMPIRWIRSYMESRFNERDEADKKRFESWAYNQRRRRERMIMRVARDSR